MLLLKHLNKQDAAAVKAYRLHVKARLYRFNYVGLVSMTPADHAGDAVPDDGAGKEGCVGEDLRVSRGGLRPDTEYDFRRPLGSVSVCIK